MLCKHFLEPVNQNLYILTIFAIGYEVFGIWAPAAIDTENT